MEHTLGTVIDGFEVFRTVVKSIKHPSFIEVSVLGLFQTYRDDIALLKVNYIAYFIITTFFIVWLSSWIVPLSLLTSSQFVFRVNVMYRGVIQS